MDPFPSLAYPPSPLPSIISIQNSLSIFFFLSCAIAKTL